jgi:hypothetical protein
MTIVLLTACSTNALAVLIDSLKRTGIPCGFGSSHVGASAR